MGVCMSTILRIVAVVGTAIAMLGAGSGLSGANTDPLVGKTYQEASSTVSGWGSTPVIATVFGGRLSTDKCTVTSWQKGKRQIDGSQTGVVLMNLYCDDAVATGSPGNSAATVEGKAAKHDIKVAAWCSLPEQAENENCGVFCPKHEGMCTANF